MLAATILLVSSAILSQAHPLDSLSRLIRSALPKPQPVPAPLAGPISAALNGPFGSVRGPLINVNFADPCVIYSDGVMYQFATNNRGLSEYGMIHVQVAKSTDNQTWTLIEGWDALPTVGKWETGHRVWAPDVVQLDDGTFVMYYADDTKWASEHHCLGVATSQNVLGPYTPRAEPWACPDVHATGGAIDPDGFLDKATGRRYVTYKIDGNSIGHGGNCGNSVPPIVPTPIMLQEVDATNGIDHIGDPQEILDRDNLDGPLIEAPTLHRSNEGVYFLFYSSNCYTTPLYDVGYATAMDIHGPYTKASRHLLGTGDGKELGLDIVGPGGPDMLKDGTVMVFHAHLTPGLGDLSLWDHINQNQDGSSGESQTSVRRRSKKSKGKHDKTSPINPLIRPGYCGNLSFQNRLASLANRPLGYENRNSTKHH